MLDDEEILEICRSVAASCLHWFKREDLDLEDLVQLAFLKLWPARPIEHRGYAWKMARNALVDHVRWRKHLGRSSYGFDRIDYEDHSRTLVAPDHADDVESRDFVASVLGHLSERDRIILDMTVGGFTQEEIGREVGLHSTTVCYHWKCLRARLRRLDGIRYRKIVEPPDDGAGGQAAGGGGEDRQSVVGRRYASRMAGSR